MPYCEFYGLHTARLAPAVDKVQRICAARDVEGWRELLGHLEMIRPTPRIGFGATPFQVDREPLSKVEYYTNQPPLSADAPPAPDAPAMRWLLTELTLMTAPLRLHGADDRFNWTFADGLALQTKYPAEDQRAEFDLFVNRLFLSQQPIDPPLDYLWTPDGYTAFLTNGEVGNLLAVEGQTRLLEHAASDLLASQSNLDRIYGEEILRVFHFLHLVHLSRRLDLYYRVFAT